jgi:hypothetical protein
MFVQERLFSVQRTAFKVLIEHFYSSRDSSTQRRDKTDNNATIFLFTFQSSLFNYLKLPTSLLGSSCFVGKCYCVQYCDIMALYVILTGSVVHRASWLVGTGESFSRVKAAVA